MFLVYHPETGLIQEMHSSDRNIASTSLYVKYTGSIDNKMVDVDTKEVIDIQPLEITNPETLEVTNFPRFQNLEFFEHQGLWMDVRRQRDQLLNETDWVVIKQTEQSGVVTEPWRVYRQALRDITTQTDPLNIVWPTRP